MSIDLVGTETSDGGKITREDAVSEVVENSPTSDQVWQELAERRLARGAPITSVLAAFHMSVLTGSHQGFTMVRRATFGLEHWADLPESDRRTALRDVAATIDPWYPPAQKRYREILAAKSDTERDEIFAAFETSGFATPNVLQALGD